MKTIYDFEAKSLQGKNIQLSEYKEKVIVVVNTASKCGFTPQYAGLEKLYQEYKGQGLVILGFPCNQFGKQEPGTEEEIKNGCLMNYGVSFPMFSKVDVNGKNAHPLFEHLKNEKRSFWGKSIQWNFTKFLIDKKGNVIKRYSPEKKPRKMEKDIIKLLEE